MILDHHGGALLRAIEELEADKGEPVIEVYVGAAERNGKIPVQLVTRSMLNRLSPSGQDDAPAVKTGAS